ncbi:MAG: hypothetical protein HKN43_12280 [Rhodothermales bacterium]|nr:hypothetical protein [Rhodothermales bacterium]
MLFKHQSHNRLQVSAGIPLVFALIVLTFGPRDFESSRFASTSFGTVRLDQPLGEQFTLPYRTNELRPVGEWSSIPRIDARSIDSETLWLARCIFSETKDPNEMELVAWVVRNRVESRYRGKRTFESTILDPFQFSAFNPSTTTRYYYSSLRPAMRIWGWQEALSIAYLVRTADVTKRPFSRDTRHFYSEVSMVGTRHPNWSRGVDPVDVDRPFDVDEKRFRFYEDVR